MPNTEKNPVQITLSGMIDEYAEYKYHLGKTVGLEKCAGDLMSNAIELFKSGDDDKAFRIRNYSLELKAVAEEIRHKHVVEYQRGLKVNLYGDIQKLLEEIFI